MGDDVVIAVGLNEVRLAGDLHKHGDARCGVLVQDMEPEAVAVETPQRIEVAVPGRRVGVGVVETGEVASHQCGDERVESSAVGVGQELHRVQVVANGIFACVALLHVAGEVLEDRTWGVVEREWLPVRRHQPP